MPYYTRLKNFNSSFVLKNPFKSLAKIAGSTRLAIVSRVPFHTRQNKFEDRGLENAFNVFPPHFGFSIHRKIPVREITRLSWCHCNQKAPFSKCLTSSLKRILKSSFFRYGSLCMAKATRRNKVAFSDFSGVVRRGLLALNFIRRSYSYNQIGTIRWNWRWTLYLRFMHIGIHI